MMDNVIRKNVYEKETNKRTSSTETQASKKADIQKLEGLEIWSNMLHIK